MKVYKVYKVYNNW